MRFTPKLLGPVLVAAVLSCGDSGSEPADFPRIEGAWSLSISTLGSPGLTCWVVWAFNGPAGAATPSSVALDVNQRATRCGGTVTYSQGETELLLGLECRAHPAQPSIAGRGLPRTFSDGRIEGDHITFTLHFEGDPNDPIVFSGTLDPGAASMHGTITTTVITQEPNEAPVSHAVSGTWTAIR